MITKAKALQSLCSNADWVLRGDKLEWLDSLQTKPTEAQIQAKIAELEAAEPLRLLRQQRNKLLTETDWRMASDYPGANQTEWQTHRQALRDITTQTPSLDSDGNLTGINWPIPPTD
jgi:hypothetical protein